MSKEYTTYSFLNKHKMPVIVRDPMWVWCVDGDLDRVVFWCGRDKRKRPLSVQGNSNKEIAILLKPDVENIELVFAEKPFTPFFNDDD